MTFLIPVIVGVLLLLMGRRLFWVFVGAIGFSAGFDIARYLFAEQNTTFMLMAGFVTGAVGIILALIFQRFAILLAGIIGGGIFAAGIVLNVLAFPGDIAVSLAFVIGAVIGGIVISVAFDPGLVVISSLIGAMIISASLPVTEGARLIIFLIALLTGLIFQSQNLSGAKERSSTSTDKTRTK